MRNASASHTSDVASNNRSIPANSKYSNPENSSSSTIYMVQTWLRKKFISEEENAGLLPTKEASIGKDYITELPHELIQMILRHCNAVTIISLTSTCRKLYLNSISFDVKWRRLCVEDFDVQLSKRGKFSSYYEIYSLLYCSRILLASFIYGRYYNRMKQINLPQWLLMWAALSRHPPNMKFGRHRIKRRINGCYLKRLNDISHGQVRKAFNLNERGDLTHLFPTRIERGTIYFSWPAVRYAGIRKHNGLENYQEFLLNKCFRARGFVERNYRKVKETDPLIAL